MSFVAGQTLTAAQLNDFSTDSLGVGTTSPETPITIVTTNKLGSSFTGTTDGEGLRVDQSNYVAGNYVSLVEASYDDGQTEPHVRIGAQFTGSGSRLAFGTSNSYGSGITNEALTVEQDGRVAIGGSAVTARQFTVRATQTAFDFRHESDVSAGGVTGGVILIGTDATNPDTGDYWILFRKGSGTTIGSVRGTGSASVNFSTTSDLTLKTDRGLASASRIGTIIDGLQVHEFDWNEGDVTDQIGLFAQEAIDVLPESIVNAPTTMPADQEGEDDEYVPAALDYSKIVPILIAECQFLRQRVAALEA